MNDNQIEEISADFVSLGRLKNLWLNGNRIASVQNLRGCRLLVHLDLGRNLLQGAASEVCCCAPMLCDHRIAR
jgi:Leucine-rich repeat (LRR) protein